MTSRDPLLDIATRRLRHRDLGTCPDELEGHESRDPACPACAAITRTETTMTSHYDDATGLLPRDTLAVDIQALAALALALADETRALREAITAPTSPDGITTLPSHHQPATTLAAIQIPTDPELPDWVYRLVWDVWRYEDCHGWTGEQAGDGTGPHDTWVCLGDALNAVPAEVIAAWGPITPTEPHGSAPHSPATPCAPDHPTPTPTGPQNGTHETGDPR